MRAKTGQEHYWAAVRLIIESLQMPCNRFGICKVNTLHERQAENREDTSRRLDDAELCRGSAHQSAAARDSASLRNLLSRPWRAWYRATMHIENLESLARVLQASISPVALVSGVGLLILSQTNRFSRVTDRLRELVHERDSGAPANAKTNRQIEIFLRRARILRLAIGAALVCVLLASVMVLVVFAMAVLDLAAQSLVVLLFALSLLSLILSIIAFLGDMHLSLKAVEESLKA
jgi:hypothetical protein